jgi:predicted AlkP superfamily phosphohydrolase/phosphomutase
MDAILGKVDARVNARTMLTACSDHGFNTYRRSFHVNSWLCEQGYMSAARAADDPKGGSPFRGVDWSRTKAYVLGFSSVYLNLEGRERDGIVRRQEAHSLATEMAEKLLAFRGPKTASR